MSIFGFLRKKDNNITKKEYYTEEVTSNLDYSKIHPDIEYLLWFGEGVRKNYDISQDSRNKYEFQGVIVEISFSSDREPSVIYPKLPIKEPDDTSIVERPQYFPTYVDLSPEQRWIYHKFLQNPYNSDINIGYVFILYYGLERNIISGRLNESFDLILKLRDVHKNKSFQNYSANALILMSLVNKRADLAYKFIESLDKEYENEIPDNLFLLLFYGLDMPLQPKDLIRMHKYFGFANSNYIKKYPKLFEETMINILFENTNSKDIYISDYVQEEDIKSAPNIDVSIFANTSIHYTIKGVPLFNRIDLLNTFAYKLLFDTHEHLKKNLAEMRKQGIDIQESNIPKMDNKVLVFDKEIEMHLLNELNKSDNLVNKHFAYMSLHEFYYKYRDLDHQYLNKCIEYCWIDIDSLDEMVKEYSIQRIEEINTALAYITGNNKEIINNLYSELDDIEKYGFKGRIVSFERLAIIYEKNKEFSKAIEVCDKALKFYLDQDFGFLKRKEKLIKKTTK